MHGSNGSASGSAKDGGSAAILLEIRDMRREAAADRQRADAKFAEFSREAAADRQRADAKFAEFRREAAADRREAAGDRKGIVQLLAQLDDHIVAQGKTLVAQGKTLARIDIGQRALVRAVTHLESGQHALVHAITDLTRTLRPPRNGRNGGNGRHRK